MPFSALQRAVLHLLFTSLTTRAESNPVLELLSLQDVPIRNHASFACTVTGSLTIVKWKKDRAIIDTTDPHYKFKSDLSELDIDVVDADDSGSYQCIAQGSDKTVYESNSKSIRVLDQPSIQPTNTKTVACKGSPVTLSCSGSDFTHVFWYFRGIEIDTRSQSRYQIGGNFNEKLVISSVTLSDAGQYACKAINQYPALTSSASQALDVEYPPVIVQGPQGGSFLEEYDITLFCNVTANPPAGIYWLKDGRFVEELGNKYEVDYVKGTLFIPNALKSAAGMYACYANNSRTCSSITIPVISKEAEVKVKDSGGLQFYAPNAYRTIVLGKSAAIKCSPNQSISENVVWSRSGKQLTSGSHLFFTADGVMMIKQATYNLSGAYECNFAGHSLGPKVKLFQRVILTVRGPPDAPHLFTPTVTVKMDAAIAFVNWTVPFDGNSPIDYYKVYFRSSGDDLWSSRVVDGSQNSTDFPLHRIETTEFYVTATNIRNSSKRSNVRRVDFVDFVSMTVLLVLNETAFTDVSAAVTSTPAGAVGLGFTASPPAPERNSLWIIISATAIPIIVVVAFVAWVTFLFRRRLSCLCKKANFISPPNVKRKGSQAPILRSTSTSSEATPSLNSPSEETATYSCSQRSGDNDDEAFYPPDLEAVSQHKQLEIVPPSQLSSEV